MPRQRRLELQRAYQPYVQHIATLLFARITKRHKGKMSEFDIHIPRQVIHQVLIPSLKRHRDTDEHVVVKQDHLFVLRHNQILSFFRESYSADAAWAAVRLYNRRGFENDTL